MGKPERREIVTSADDRNKLTRYDSSGHALLHEEINTTTRWNNYCVAKNKEGVRCSLYTGHFGDHLPKHGIESQRFKEGE